MPETLKQTASALAKWAKAIEKFARSPKEDKKLRLAGVHKFMTGIKPLMKQQSPKRPPSNQRPLPTSKLKDLSPKILNEINGIDLVYKQNIVYYKDNAFVKKAFGASPPINFENWELAEFIREIAKK